MQKEDGYRQINRYDRENLRCQTEEDGNIKDREIRTFYIADSRTADPFVAAVEEALKMVKK